MKNNQKMHWLFWLLIPFVIWLAFAWAQGVANVVIPEASAYYEHYNIIKYNGNTGYGWYTGTEDQFKAYKPNSLYVITSKAYDNNQSVNLYQTPEESQQNINNNHYLKEGIKKETIIVDGISYDKQVWLEFLNSLTQ